MLGFKEDAINKTIIITVNGFIDKDDAEFHLLHLKRKFDNWDDIKIVIMIENFEGVDFNSFMKFNRFILIHVKKIKKVALITHNLLSGWQGFLGWFFAGLGFFVSLPLVYKFKHFSFNKMEKAKGWILSEDLKEKNAS